MREYNLFVQNDEGTVWICHERTPLQLTRAMPGGKSAVVFEGEPDDLGIRLADTTCREVGRALWDISNATGKTYFAAIHPCGGIAIVEGDLFHSTKLQAVPQWATNEQIIEAITKLGENP